MNILKQVDKTTIRLTKDGVTKTYTGYNVGELPPSFAFFYNEDKDNFGINTWFNYKGLTYVSK